MKEEYIKVMREKGEIDFEVSAVIMNLARDEYEKVKSMIITAIGAMEEMRRNNINQWLKEKVDE